MKKILPLIIFSALVAFSNAGFAQQNNIPELPAPIENLVSEGAQVRFLGRDHGLDAWLTIKNGQEQYFYVMPNQDAFLMGVLFDKDGKLVTVNQVQRLRSQGDSVLDNLTEDQFAGLKKTQTPDDQSFNFKSPSERLYFDIENSNWVPLGEQGAPVLYSFIDPQCPHCHEFIKDLKANYITKGRVQLRMIPVGFRDETRAQAAFLLATPNPTQHWYAHMDGDETALPAKSELNQQGVQRNLSIMQSWKLNATPMVVYRGLDGSVKIVQGRPKDLPKVIADIGVRG